MVTFSETGAPDVTELFVSSSADGSVGSRSSSVVLSWSLAVGEDVGGEERGD